MNESLTIESLVARTFELLRDQDRFAAVEMLAQHDPQLAAEVYAKLQSDLYWKRKDVPLMVAMSLAGIQHCLMAANRAGDANAATAFRGSAKGLSFNLASFTWPGWDEKEIILLRSDIATGRDAARLNLRLAEKLDRPPKAKANAHWAIGAHEMVINNYEHAAQAFELGATCAMQGNEAVLARMLDGYATMSRLLASPENTENRAKFEGIVADLKRDPAEDAAAFADQLVSVLNVFQSATVSIE